MAQLNSRPVAPRIAIVSDALFQSGGAERVVEVLAEAFPSAPIFTILYDRERGPHSLEHRIIESWLRYIPGAARNARALLPFFTNAIESFDLRGYDVIISSHHTLAKGVLRTADQTHICYCHTPMRALWELPHDEIRRAPRVLRPFVQSLLHHLRNWDFTTASRVDRFIANSELTAIRIAKHYRRESTVVYPPIDTERFRPGGVIEDYYLVASRNVPYKRIDLAVAAAELLGRKLIVTGDNTNRLKPDSNYVSYLGKVSDSDLVRLMQRARALLFPQQEDFGMTVIEMNACGRPVIAFGKGGALETIVEGQTGITFPEQSVESLVDAIQRFEMMEFDARVLRLHAERFSKDRFVQALREIVSDETQSRSTVATRRERYSLAGL